MELGPCRESGINTRTTKEIEGEFSLRQKAVPKVQWEVFVSAAEASNEMIFESTDGSVSGIASVHARGYKLVVNVFIYEELFQGGQAFSVETL